jgi:hypothetical protein
MVMAHLEYLGTEKDGGMEIKEVVMMEQVPVAVYY